MTDNIDASLRLAALQSALAISGSIATSFDVLAKAREFHSFLEGERLTVPLAPFPKEIFENLAPKTIDQLPLDGHNLVPSPEAVAEAKRKRRTKAEMEAARAAEDEAKDLEAAATRAKVRAEIAKLDAVEAARAAVAESDPVAAAMFATAATPAPVAAAPEVADVKAALMKVVEKDGLGPTAGGKLLAQFGVKRVSELDAKTFAEFIAACNAAVAA